MKSKLPFPTLANSAVADAINDALGAFNELNLADGEKEKRYLYCRYGTYPQQVPGIGVVQQVVDPEAAAQIVANFRKSAGLEVMFKGVPHYEGHPDDPAWLAQNPGHKPIAVGRIKQVEAGEDGIYVTSVFNTIGVPLLSGSAPAYDGHSPRWRLSAIPGKPKHYRPVMLLSDGLTNNPNIPGSRIALNAAAAAASSPDENPASGAQTENQTDHMKLTPEALKALGFAPDATPSEADISAATMKLLGEKQSSDAAKATAETAANTANGQVTALNTELAAVRGKLSETVAANAVTQGRITEADKPKWITALNTDFDGESAKLGKLMPALNTSSQLPGDISSRRDPNVVDMAGGMEAMNAAARAYASEHNIDISNTDGWNRAWNGAKAAKPEVFHREAK
jgi:hypothetical protein